MNCRNFDRRLVLSFERNSRETALLESLAMCDKIAWLKLLFVTNPRRKVTGHLSASPRKLTSKSPKEWKKICLQNKIPPLSRKASSRQTRICPDFTTSSRPTKQAPILKYDLSYPTSMDPPNTFDGFLPTPLNR
ncbi:hypothetical protein pdam_00023956 [Pocillopora damicornis]|uniref:Uncharacterized protein n=1 Tax=Pocillopora damicornis TaxID=46731 RepID=A0A3M6U733_POCDA|nr:hypothetical protein pdam_00023956 [Pocillopora damicornis]